MLSAIFIGLLSIASPFLIQILTDDVLVRGDIKLLNAIAFAAMIMSVTSNCLRVVQSHLIAHFTQRLKLGLVLEFRRKILHLPLSYYEAHRSDEIVSRLQDIQVINQLVSQVIVSLPSQLFLALISLSFMLLYSWKLTIVALGIASMMTLSTVTFLPTVQQNNRKLLVLEAENQGVLVETFKGALTLKTTTVAPQWEEFQAKFGHLANSTFSTI